MSTLENKLFEIASGDITVWLDDSGGIYLKINSEYKDPVELNETEARYLAELLLRLADEMR